MPIVVSPKRKKKRKIGMNKKTYNFLAFIFFILGIMFYVIFFSGALKVNNIEHIGESTITGEEIDKVINDYLDQEGFFSKRKNIFLVDTNEIESLLKENVPKIDQIQVDKKPLHGLLVDLTEKRSKGIYCNQECYYFDDEGLAYELAPQTEGFLILNVKDNRKKEINLGDEVLEKNILSSIFNTRDKFNDLTDIEVRSFIIPSASFDEFWVETEENWLVYMTYDSTQRQIEDLGIFLKNNLNDRERSELEYVDVRLEGRAYYKFKGVDVEE